jgi:hypothetical protein
LNWDYLKTLPTGAKFFLGFTVIFGAIRMLEFIFDGQEIYYLLGALGWWSLTYGAYRNGFVPKSAQSMAGNVATIVGIGLLTASFALKYFFK